MDERNGGKRSRGRVLQGITVGLLVIGASGCLVPPAKVLWAGAANRLLDMATVPDGGYILALSTRENNLSPPRLYLVHVNASLEVMWQRGFGTLAPDDPAAVCVLPEGGFGLYGGGILTLTSDSGTPIQTIEADGDGIAVLAGASGNVYIADPMSLRKIDTTGAVTWSLDIPAELGLDSGDAFVADGVLLGDESIVLAGSAWQEANAKQPFSSVDSFLMKVSRDGTREWVGFYGAETARKQFGEEAADDYARALTTTGDGGFLLAGDSLPTFIADIPPTGIVTKVAANGDALWTRTYEATGNTFVDVAAADDGSFYLAGYPAIGYEFFRSTARKLRMLRVTRIDGEGAVIWDQTYDLGLLGQGTSDAIVAREDGGAVLGATVASRIGSRYERSKLVPLEASGERERVALGSWF